MVKFRNALILFAAVAGFVPCVAPVSARGYAASHAAAFAKGRDALEAWFRANTGPKIALTKSFTGTFEVRSQADADRLTGTLVSGRVVIFASHVALGNFAVSGAKRDPAVYDYAVLPADTVIDGDYDGRRYRKELLRAGRADPRVPGAVAKERALAAMWTPLVSVVNGASHIVIRDFRIDGNDERIYSGMGGTSRSLHVTVERGEIVRTGDDGAKQFTRSTFRHCYIHDLRPWKRESDGPFYSGPNNSRYPHLDPLQATRGDRNLIEGNWLENSYTSTATAGGNLVKPDEGQNITRYTMRRNYMAGGNNYVAHFLNQSGVLDPRGGATVKGIVIRDNLIGRPPAGMRPGAQGQAAKTPKSPFSAPLYADQIRFSGNVWADTREPVPLPLLPTRP